MFLQASLVSCILHRDCGTLSHRFVVTPRRRYPIQQAQYSLLGVLPTVCWNGCHKKTVLSPRNSKMVCSPVTVRIAPPDSKLTRSPLWVLSNVCISFILFRFSDKAEREIAAYLNEKSQILVIEPSFGFVCLRLYLWLPRVISVSV